MDAARTANKLLLQLKDMELPLEQDGKRINCTLGEGYYGLINGAWETVLHFKDWNVIQVFLSFLLFSFVVYHIDRQKII